MWSARRRDGQFPGVAGLLRLENVPKLSWFGSLARDTFLKRQPSTPIKLRTKCQT